MDLEDALAAADSVAETAVPGDEPEPRRLSQLRAGLRVVTESEVKQSLRSPGKGGNDDNVSPAAHAGSASPRTRAKAKAKSGAATGLSDYASMLVKAPEHRLPGEVAVLVGFVEDKLSLPLSKAARAELVNVMAYHNINVPTILTQQGDKADTFYAILAGEVQQEHENAQGHVVRKTLGVGDTFGAAALTTERPRAHTFSVHHSCELIAITRRQFRSLLLPRTEKEVNRRLAVLAEADAFRNMGRSHMRALAHTSILCTYKKGQLILSKGTVPFNAYTIVKGTVRVTSTDMPNARVTVGVGHVHGFRSRTIARRDIAVLGPGQVFGLNCLLESERDDESNHVASSSLHPAAMPVNIVAATPVELVMISVVRAGGVRAAAANSTASQTPTSPVCWSGVALLCLGCGFVAARLAQGHFP